MRTGEECAVRAAESAEEYGEARRLFVEYADSLGFSLCFQDFDKELAGLPGEYAAARRGALLLAHCGAEAVGCVAVHACPGAEGDGVCEMKRLYVKPEWQGRGMGRTLVERAIEEARRLGYGRMRLDTVRSKMAKAIAMYERFGFYEIGAYRANPAPDVVYMEVELRGAG